MSGRLRGGIWVAHGGAQAGARRGLRLMLCAAAVSFALLASCSQALAAGTRTTLLSLSCPSKVVAGGKALCTATVADTGTPPPGSAPSGTVLLSSEPPEPPGAFSSECVLKPIAEKPEASCSVEFTPAKAGPTKITAKYEGDLEHAAATDAQQSLKVDERTTQTTFNCGAGVLVGQATACTATVTDTSLAGTSSAAKGMVTFESDLEGVGPTGTCTLEPTADPGAASCVVPYTPSKAGTAKVTAKYPGGDGVHAKSESPQEGVTATVPTSPPQPQPQPQPVQGGTTTAPPAPTPTLPRPPVPICRVSVSELARTIGRRGHRHKVPSLSVTYTCDQTATVRITGVVTIAGRIRAGRKTRATNLALSPAKAPATAGKASSPVFLTLPPAAVKALNTGRRTTTALSLTVQNANGRSLGTLRLTLIAQSALRRK